MWGELPGPPSEYPQVSGLSGHCISASLYPLPSHPFATSLLSHSCCHSRSLSSCCSFVPLSLSLMKPLEGPRSCWGPPGPSLLPKEAVQHEIPTGECVSPPEHSPHHPHRHQRVEQSGDIPGSESCCFGCTVWCSPPTGPVSSLPYCPALQAVPCPCTWGVITLLNPNAFLCGLLCTPSM